MAPFSHQQVRAAFEAFAVEVELGRRLLLAAFAEEEQRLMEQAEAEARAKGKTLLVRDTVTGDTAERLYERLGWNRVGVIPGYALYPDGQPCDTTVFWKSL